jgi:hypothetical protein
MRIFSAGSVRFVVTCFAVLLLISRFSTGAFAQGGVGTITGTVTDPKGLTVAQASVVIKNTDTGIERPPILTSDSGNYASAFLQPGHYEVRISKDGFSPIVRKDILLQVGQTLTIDLVLTVGTTVSEITVTGEAPIIEPDRTEVSQTVSQVLAEGLPLNGRRWQSFVFLTPGVTTDGTTGLVTYHGISSLYNNSEVDGVSNQQAFFSEDRGRTVVGYTYSLDAVKEFNVNSDAYSAEFGHAAGGEVNAVTKSGANDLHGDLFYYLRYPSLNALDPFARTHGGNPINDACPVGTTLNTSIKGSAECITQGEHQRQQFGGSVGGAIIKDKLFYFVNYDGQRRSFPIIYTGPSTGFAATALNNMIANNCAASNTKAPVVTIVGFAANDPRCAAAVNFINAFTGPAPREANQDIALGKLDYQATASNHLSVSFNWMNFNGPNLNNANSTQITGSTLQNGTLITHDRYLVGSWDAVVSPSIVNDFRFQWSRDLQVTSSNFSGPSVFLGPNSTTGFFGYGNPNSLPRPAFPDEHRLEFADTVSYVHGNHAIKAGIDISPIHDVLINLFNGAGIYNYNFDNSSAASAAATLQAWIADLYNLPLSSDGLTGALTGKHYNQFFQSTDLLHPTSKQGSDDFYDVDYGFFVQDTWKATSALTINMGVRYDLQVVPQPPDPNKNAFAALYTSKIYLDKSNVAPRLGVAYQPMKNLVVRGGFGLFFGKTTNSTYYNTRSENGQVQQQAECDVTYLPSTGAFSAGTQAACAPVFPNIFFAAPGPPLAAPPGIPGAIVPSVTTPATPVAANLRGQTPVFLQPMVYEAEGGVEYELPGNISVSASYVFNRGAHLPVCNDVNLAPATLTATYQIAGGTFATGKTVPTGGTVTVPFYTQRLNNGVGIVDACESTVHTRYQAGIFTAKKSFGHGLEFLANYTLSRSLDDEETTSSNGTSGGTFGGNTNDVTIDPYNQQGEWANSDFNQPQRLVTSFTYSPTFKIQNPILVMWPTASDLVESSRLLPPFRKLPS